MLVRFFSIPSSTESKPWAAGRVGLRPSIRFVAEVALMDLLAEKFERVTRDEHHGNITSPPAWWPDFLG